MLRIKVLAEVTGSDLEVHAKLEFAREGKLALRLELAPDARRPDEEPTIVPGLRCTPPAGALGMVDNNGFCGSEEGRTERGDKEGFCSIWRSLASRAAILSSVLHPEIL